MCHLSSQSLLLFLLGKAQIYDMEKYTSSQLLFYCTITTRINRDIPRSTALKRDLAAESFAVIICDNGLVF